MNNKIVLFDLDGTLTPSRGYITKENESAIYRLLDTGARVAIVTGSSLEYVLEQMPSQMFEKGVEVFSCNGTKHNIYVDGKWKTIGDNHDIKDVLGDVAYSQLILTLLQAQRYAMMSYNLPFTGCFISYRGGMVNWSPIGREATKKQRETFVEFDMKNSWRNKMIESIKNNLLGLPLKNNVKLLIKLAGETSFDIYPEGWDKTIALKSLPADSKIWFVGDRCFENGNDKEIYNEVNKKGKAYSIKNHSQTSEIIEDIIRQIEKMEETIKQIQEDLNA